MPEQRPIYQIRMPNCPWVEVDEYRYLNPPQYAWLPKIEYERRVLVEVQESAQDARE